MWRMALLIGAFCAPFVLWPEADQRFQAIAAIAAGLVAYAVIMCWGAENDVVPSVVRSKVEVMMLDKEGDKVRCVIVRADGYEIAPGLFTATPPESLPHIGKFGWAMRVDGDVKITPDDGTVIMGWECWRKPCDNPITKD